MPSRRERNCKGLHAKQEGMELKGPACQAGGNGIERACMPSRTERNCKGLHAKQEGKEL